MNLSDGSQIIMKEVTALKFQKPKFEGAQPIEGARLTSLNKNIIKRAQQIQQFVGEKRTLLSDLSVDYEQQRFLERVKAIYERKEI